MVDVQSAAATAPRPATLVPVKRSKGHGTLVFLPDLGGSFLYARNLIAKLDVACDVYGLRLDDELLRRLPELSLQDIAQRFACDLLVLPSNKPLCLVGHSFSGFLAFETAHALAGLGVDVGLLAMLDSDLPPRFSERPKTFSYRWLKRKARGLKARLQQGWRRLAARGTAPGSQDILFEPGFVRLDLSRHPGPIRDIIRQLYRAMVAYQPSHYSGAMTLVIATDEWHSAGAQPDLGWTRYAAGGVDVVRVAGDHLSIVADDPGSAAVAQVLQSRITALTGSDSRD